jgi:adenylosuccinate synthase
MKVDVLLGLQWGDEGKGKIVDILSPRYDIVARFQGGPNAGHTIKFDNKKFILHTIPSGIFNKDKLNLVGNGVILDPQILMSEISGLEKSGINARSNLLISRKAHLILPTHRLLDATQEKMLGKSKIGSTLKGIGPSYTDKISRKGLRVGDICSNTFKNSYQKLKEYHIDLVKYYNYSKNDFLIDGLSFDEYEENWLKAAEQVKSLNIIDSEHFINQKLDKGARVLAEGAQGTMLDIDFGSYPFVTSSNTITGGVCSGLGISPKRIGKVMGVFKAYCTRVGSGPFPTELLNGQGDTMREAGQEFGSTTGRPRRCGWLDLVALKYAIMLNGVEEMFMMKTDVLDNFDKILVGIAYRQGGVTMEQLPFDLSEGEYEPLLRDFSGWKSSLADSFENNDMPGALDKFINYIEESTGVPVSLVSFGPDRAQVFENQRMKD